MAILPKQITGQLLRRAAGGFAKNTVKTPFKLLRDPRSLFGAGGSIRTDIKAINSFSRDGKNFQGMAMASGRLLGTAAGITYVSRAIRGKSPVKDAGGKRDILPWVPFV